MSVWPKAEPSGTSLAGSEGDLVSISIDVDPRYLESLLEALAQLPFPVNPEIFHDAAIVCRDAAGREDVRDTTLVEFPAYASRLDDVRRGLKAYGFPPSSVHVTSMLDEIQGDSASEATAGAGHYVSCNRVKHRSTVVH